MTTVSKLNSHVPLTAERIDATESWQLAYNWHMQNAGAWARRSSSYKDGRWGRMLADRATWLSAWHARQAAELAEDYCLAFDHEIDD